MGYNPFSGGSSSPAPGRTKNYFGSEGGSEGKYDVLGNSLDKANPWVQGARKKDAAAQAVKDSQASQQGSVQNTMDQMTKSGNSYYDQMNNAYTGAGGYQQKMNAATNTYLGQAGQLKTDMENQAKDSKTTYSNDILPKLKSNMEDAQTQAAGAMTLQQAGDPNNSVATGVRQMYGDQAQGINREGLADAGVLQAMGSQATAGQFAGAGGMMTGGQLQAIQGANMGQSGAAMARAQQRANDLRQQGIQAGFDQSAAQYGRGVDAKNYANQTIGNYQNSYNSMNQQQDMARQNIGAQQQNIFGTTMGQANANLGIGTGLAGLRYGIDTQGQNRQMAFDNDKAGVTQGNLINQIAAQNAKDQAMAGAAGQIGGGIIGGMAGGPAGAAVGSQAGGAVGNAAGAQGQTQVPAQANYGNVGGGQQGNPYGPYAGSAPGGGYDGGYSNMARNPYQAQNPYAQR